MVCRIT